MEIHGSERLRIWAVSRDAEGLCLEMHLQNAECGMDWERKLWSIVDAQWSAVAFIDRWLSFVQTYQIHVTNVDSKTTCQYESNLSMILMTKYVLIVQFINYMHAEYGS